VGEVGEGTMKTATVVRPRFGVAAPLGISLLPCLLLRASSCSCSVYPRTNALRRRRAATRRPHGIPLHQIDPSFSPPPLVPLVDHTMCRPRSGLRSEEARGTRIPTGLPMVLLTRAYGAKPFYLSGCLCREVIRSHGLLSVVPVSGYLMRNSRNESSLFSASFAASSSKSKEGNS
jgi:hypothetical protein